MTISSTLIAFKSQLKNLFCVAAFFSLSAVVAAAEPVAKSKQGVAIDGHDTVAYHSLERAPQAAAVEGVSELVVTWKGAEWRFGSKESADLFRADPERYSPAYNGHCANALSLGRGLVPTDGTNWEIFGDKLYLFFAPRGRDRWLDGNWETYKVESDKEWARLSGG